MRRAASIASARLLTPGAIRAHASSKAGSATGVVRFRRGWFLGDGTGCGKGRQVAGIILDNWLLKGRRKALWISKSELIEDARRDWSALGQKRLLIQPLARIRQGTPTRLCEGILFVTLRHAALGRARGQGGRRTLNAQAKSAAWSAFESTKQRFYNHLLTAMKTATLIESIEGDLRPGTPPSAPG